MEINYICKFCSKVCKNANSLRNHERLCPTNPDRNYVSHTLGHTAWNKGLTKATDERVKQYSESCSKSQTGKVGKKHTDDYKKRMSEIAKQRHLGGWHTSKTIEYNGIKLDSQYEFEVAKTLDEHLITWERPSYLIWKDDKGSEHRYYPDFYLPDYNVYLDPKNDFLINNNSKRFGITDTEKIKLVSEQNCVTIIILDKNNLSWENIKKLLN